MKPPVIVAFTFLAVGVLAGFLLESTPLIGTCVFLAVALAVIISVDWRWLRFNTPAGGVEMERLQAEVEKAVTTIEAEGVSETDRREAIRRLMETAAQWGWAMTAVWDDRPPVPHLEWDKEGNPTILYGSPKDESDNVFGL